MGSFDPAMRRTILRRATVLGTAIVAGCLDSEGDADEPVGNGADDAVENGAVTFVYDDGPVEDVEIALPAHEKYDVPASAGIVSNWMESNDDQWLDTDGVATLSDAGWEIACHTADHVALTSFELVEDVEPGDSRIYPEGRGQHGFVTGHPIEVTDGETVLRRTIVASDDDEIGRYFTLDEPIDESFAAGETVERYPSDFVRQQLETSIDALSEFDPTTFLAPHNVIDDRHIDIVSDYYDGIFNVHSGDPANEVPFDPFDTNRSYFAERVDRNEVYDDLERIADENLYGILGAHTYRDAVTRERIEETLEWCAELGIEVLTFEDAISRNAVE